MTAGRWRALAAAVAAAGCGAPAGEPVDAAPVDAGVDAAVADSPCPTPASCPWLDDELRQVVGSLTGERPLPDGVVLAARASVVERDAARAYLADRLAALGLEVELHDYGTGRNVVARLPATRGDGAGLIVVGAHFDGVAAGPAAADNATGTALVVAAARFLRGVTPRDRAVELVLFDQEEVGLVGSGLYAARLVADGVEVDSVHVFDMLSFDGDGDGAAELWSPAPGLAALYAEHGAALGIPTSAVTFAYSDHQSFLDRGLPAIGVSEEFVGGDATPHYHQATDTYDNVDFAHLASITGLALTVLADRVADGP
jgi:hypothetical protein